MTATSHHSLPELARAAGLSESTARRYAKEFANYLPAEQLGRVRMFRGECAQGLNRIRDLYAEGLSTAQVHETLHVEFDQVVEVSHKEHSQPTESSSGPSAQDIVGELLQQLRNPQQQALPDPGTLEHIKQRLEDLERRVQALESKRGLLRKLFKSSF